MSQTLPAPYKFVFVDNDTYYGPLAKHERRVVFDYLDHESFAATCQGFYADKGTTTLRIENWEFVRSIIDEINNSLETSIRDMGFNYYLHFAHRQPNTSSRYNMYSIFLKFGRMETVADYLAKHSESPFPLSGSDTPTSEMTSNGSNSNS
ncbi:hypothetical protein TWF481_000126 [Arthrobotrys musiformis]|uniref:Uncharacterized protein n=1 Tax=Arthrobotrys musiformis TaxID=47236 RepID=A0AAV9WNV0_9PEZI